MEIEPLDVFGFRGRDFVLFNEGGDVRFEARQLEGSTTLSVIWTSNLPWALHRLRAAQRFAGGPGSFERIEGFGTDEFATTLNPRFFGESVIQNCLSRALKGSWSVRIRVLPNSRINFVANRLGEAMKSEISRYWPFDVGPRERHTDREKQEVRFLETAYGSGFRPFELGLGMESYGATGEEGRSAEILCRGRNGWEMAVYDVEQRVVNAFVGDFECAAEAVLDWLGGGQQADVLARVKTHLMIMPGLRGGHELVVWTSETDPTPPSR